eukprot:UN05794
MRLFVISYNKIVLISTEKPIVHVLIALYYKLKELRPSKYLF